MKSFIIILLFCVSSITGFSQGDTGNDPDFPDVPLDAGISLLVAAGVAYTTRRVLKKKVNDEQKGY